MGQGPFYTEQHHDASKTRTLVYDCGSLTAPKDRLLRKAATALPPESVSDLLFISHFHTNDPQAYFGPETLIIRIVPVGGPGSQPGATAENDNGPFIDVPAERDAVPTVPNDAVTRLGGRRQTVAIGIPVGFLRKAGCRG